MVWRIVIKTEIPYDPVTPLLGIYSNLKTFEAFENINLKGNCSPGIAVLLIIDKYGFSLTVPKTRPWDI